MTFPRALLLLTLLLTASLGARAESRPVGPASLDQALRDAHLLAAGYEQAEVVRVAGDSMLPFFGDGSVLVTKPVAPERLLPGMVVVYRNRFGETVAHRVEGRTEDGWIVRGFNNDRADSTAVNASNLLGVVYGTFYSNGRVEDEAAVAAVLAHTPVALAAPAR